MATVERDRQSNEGSERGFDGISIAPEKWIVKFTAGEDHTQDPSLILQTHTSGVALGQYFKWGAFGAICSGYRIGRPLGHNGWEVYALYKPLTINVSGWKYSVRGFLDSEHIFETVERDVEARKLIAPYQYDVVSAEFGPPDYTHFLEGSVPTVYLKQKLGRDTTQIDGFDTPKPSFSVYFERDDLQNVTINKVGAAGVYLAKVNDAAVIFGDQATFSIPRSIMCSEIVVDQIFASDPTTTPINDGIGYRVSVRFDVKLEGFTPLELLHTKEDSEGVRHFVKAVVNGQRVLEEFRVVREIPNLGAVLTVLAS